MAKDARGHGSELRSAVAGVNRAAGTWAQGILNAQAKLNAESKNHGMKTTAEALADHERIWGHGTRSIAAQHGIPTSHLDSKK